MADSSSEIFRHALTIARRKGYSEVEVETADASLEAKLERLSYQAAQQFSSSEHPEQPSSLELTVQFVGYYRPTKPALAVGMHVTKGDHIAVIEALGLANDVEATATGEVLEVLVASGDPVQYGQAIARVKVTP